ncbi:MAG: hypothetical protein ACFB2W_03070 [Leptolyngbyaceae cyanobacterium]
MNGFFRNTDRLICGLPFYTWTDQWAKTLNLLGRELSELETIIINIDPDEPYGLTYSIPKKNKISRELNKAVDNLAEMLLKISSQRGIIMFENLLSEKFTSKSLHSLFSLLSKRINDKQGLTNSISLHSPIKSESHDRGFPIHADLFKARAILNIISQVDQVEGGDIILISFEELLDAMHETSSMPTSVINFVQNIVSKRTSCDRFHSIFDLMHGNYPWVSHLEAAIETRQICIPSSYGVGYFIVDGQWLHGRTKINGPVFETRLERLVFDTEDTISLQPLSPNVDIESSQHPIYADNTLFFKAEKSFLNKHLSKKSLDQSKASTVN